MVDAKQIAEKINYAFKLESEALYQKVERKNSRAYPCSINGCINNALADGLCNAHYIRKKRGKDLHEPLRHRRRDSKCRECEKPVDGKGGWSLCKSHYNKRRREIMRSVCIDALGGACSRCGEIYPHYVYDFHHTGDQKKDFAISDAIKSASADDIAAEVSKCILLCANCHRITHNGPK